MGGSWLGNWSERTKGLSTNLVVPPNLATEDVPFGAGDLRSPVRSQLVYGANLFPTGALAITEIRFRPDSTYGSAFTTTVASFEVRLSTTTNAPDRLQAAFANNIGPDETVVFSGALNISSQFTGPPGGPKVFDIVIPFTTPFVYAPAWGNLLVDLRNRSGSSASLLSGQGLSTDSASRVSGAVNSSTGGADTGINAIEIVYTPTEEPPPPPPPPLQLTRGPYLQSLTTTNIIVRWRTNRDTNSQVRFGLRADALNWEVSAGNPTPEHILTLTNLAPDTKYFYAIGASETNLAGGADCHFVTAPLRARPVRIWVTGDTRATFYEDGRDGRQAVRDAYLEFARNRPADFFVNTGDIAGSGRDEEYQTQFFDVYAAPLRNTVFYPCLGNHDLGAPGAAPYLDSFSLPANGEAGGVPSGTERYYSFDYADVHFVVLDIYGPNILQLGNLDPAYVQAELDWLRADLSANSRTWLVAMFHDPPYTRGSHNSDWEWDCLAVRTNFLPVLESFGVDLALFGHSHSYERSYLLRGHYGISTTLTEAMKLDDGDGRPEGDGPYVKADGLAGTVYVVVGSSGFLGGGAFGHPAMFYSANALGSLVLDIDGNTLSGKFLRSTGAIDDSFTLIKRADDGGFRFTSVEAGGGTVTLRWNSVPGRLYRVHRRTSFESPWQPVSGDLSGTGSVVTWVDASPPSAGAFYQVERRSE